MCGSSSTSRPSSASKYASRSRSSVDNVPLVIACVSLMNSPLPLLSTNSQTHVSELELPYVSELELPHVSELELPHVSELELPYVSELELPHVSELERRMWDANCVCMGLELPYAVEVELRRSSRIRAQGLYPG